MIDARDKQALAKITVAAFLFAFCALFIACILGIAVRLFTLVAFAPLF